MATWEGIMDAIKLLEQWVKEDRESRNSTESDFDKFCEERNKAIEELIWLARVGQATEKVFGYIDNEHQKVGLFEYEDWGHWGTSGEDVEFRTVDELLEWADE